MKQISSALVKAQKAFGPALKTSVNPHFRNKYASLDVCIEAVVGALNDNGIMLMQQTHLCDDGVIVETVFIHESGETLSGGKLHVPASKQDPQGYGSALTYAKRYSLQSACGIAPEDNDGGGAKKDGAMNLRELENWIVEIQTSGDEESLKRIYTGAIKAAKNDEAAKMRLIAAKDDKKGSL